VIGPAYFIVAVFYVALAAAPTLPLAALAVLCAHVGGSILWVFSTVLLQMEVPDRLRGRVFAAELGLVTITTSLSSYFTAVALDRAGWSPRTLAFLLGLSFCVPGAIWMLILSRWRDSDREAQLTPALAYDPVDTVSAEEEVLKGRI